MPGGTCQELTAQDTGATHRYDKVTHMLLAWYACGLARHGILRAAQSSETHHGHWTGQRNGDVHFGQLLTVFIEPTLNHCNQNILSYRS